MTREEFHARWGIWPRDTAYVVICPECERVAIVHRTDARTCGRATCRSRRARGGGHGVFEKGEFQAAHVHPFLAMQMKALMLLVPDVEKAIDRGEVDHPTRLDRLAEPWRIRALDALLQEHQRREGATATG